MDSNLIPLSEGDDFLLDPEEGEDENWFSYLYRTHHRRVGEEIPYPGSEWTYHTSDSDLHDQVMDALYSAQDFDASQILVTVFNGTVYLTGQVSSEESSRLAVYTAAGVEGVWRVENRLKISQ